MTNEAHWTKSYQKIAIPAAKCILVNALAMYRKSKDDTDTYVGKAYWLNDRFVITDGITAIFLDKELPELPVYTGDVSNAFNPFPYLDKAKEHNRVQYETEMMSQKLLTKHIQLVKDHNPELFKERNDVLIGFKYNDKIQIGFNAKYLLNLVKILGPNTKMYGDDYGFFDFKPVYFCSDIGEAVLCPCRLQMADNMKRAGTPYPLHKEGESV